MENKNLWFGILPPHWKYGKIGILFSERRTKVSDKNYKPLSVAKMGMIGLTSIFCFLAGKRENTSKKIINKGRI